MMADEDRTSGSTQVDTSFSAPKDDREMPDPPPVHPFILEVLRGLGQVVFCNSTLTGTLVVAGLFFADPKLAGLALTGCASATATARLVGADAGATTAGLMGYNGALAGCAFSVFLLGIPLEWKALATVVGGIVSTLITVMLGRLIAPAPQFTWAFNITVLAALAYYRPFQGEAGATTPRLRLNMLEVYDWVCGCLKGVSQIFVSNNEVTGLLILLGIFTYSPFAAAATLSGSAIGAVTAYVVGADAEEVEEGIWGFNPALTALAVSVFFVPLGLPYAVLAVGGAAAAAVSFIGFKATVFGAIQAPCLTLPFCAVASCCYLLGGRVPGLVRARVPHSPEANLQAYHRLP